MFKIKGNYFFGNFKLPLTSGIDKTELFIEKFCPANTDQQLWKVPIEYRHLKECGESLHEGQQHLKKISFDDRVKFIKKLIQHFREFESLFTESIMLETGRSRWDAQKEIERTKKILLFSLQYTDDYRQTHIQKSEEKIYYRAIGPAVIISSFSAPLSVPMEQIIYLFLSGNALILKPSEEVLYTTQLIFELLHLCEFPKGSVNLLLGDQEMSIRLIKEKLANNVYFSGSSENGKNIIQLLPNDLQTKFNLQLSSKNTTIIDKDVQLEYIIAPILESCYKSSGQLASSTSIIACHRSIIDEVITSFHKIAKKIKIDHPTNFEHEPFMGPLIGQQVMDTYIQYMGMAKREGIEEIMRGKQIEKKYRGFYVSPSIHLAEKFNSKGHFLTSEIFAPNVTFIPFDTIDQAFSIANSTNFGLITSIFTNDQDTKHLALENIQSGLIHINQNTTNYSCEVPFGGVKDSSNFSKVGVSMFENGLDMISSLDHPIEKLKNYNLTGL